MKRIITFFSLTFLLICPLLQGPVFAGEDLKGLLSEKYKEEKDICKVVKQAIKDGLNAKDVTRDSIQMGHDACLVIRCGIEAKGNLGQIINGALEAGTTTDVCSRCAVDAGADPNDVQPYTQEFPAPNPIPMPEQPAKVISPSSF
jgi:hypothetical protein